MAMVARSIGRSSLLLPTAHYLPAYYRMQAAGLSELIDAGYNSLIAPGNDLIYMFCRLLSWLAFVAVALPAQALASDLTFSNPILRGGYPDPSICRVGNDYYIVNSTFEYFPGLPIHHSTDLVNWELIGYGLHRAEQATGAVNLVDVQSNGGIHAPTIRCRDGKFYIITTNVL